MFYFFHKLGIIIPADYFFFKMVKSTNQKIWACSTCPKVCEMIVLGLYQEVETIDVSLKTLTGYLTD